ncbi:MAG TPA: hypothetical protein VNO26_02620 [Candidatus Limnocylindria bacterium]|nr:hypothetical protein [Candidatus Limnocylindria bacterium]
MANKKSVLLASAAAGLLAAGTLIAPTPAFAEEVECYGVNSCKGKGACGGKGHTCAGQNACKGQGWIKMDKEECLKQGGRLTAEEKK